MSGPVSAGAWTGPIRFEAAGVPYAGMLRLVDVDEDERIVGAHGQARATRGWAGVAAAISVRANGRGAYALDAEVQLSGDAADEAGEALLAAVRARLDAAGGTPMSPADDPAWRRKLAGRAAIAVAVGAAAGLAGAAWGRRRRG